MTTCYACGQHKEEADFKDQVIRVFTQTLHYLDQRRRWSEKLTAEGMRAPWSDPIDRLCIVVGIVTNDLRDETKANPSLLINGSNVYLNDFTAWLVQRKKAPKKPTPVQTINDWGLCGCVGWDGPAKFLPEYLDEIRQGSWVPKPKTIWREV